MVLSFEMQEMGKAFKNFVILLLISVFVSLVLDFIGTIIGLIAYGLVISKVGQVQRQTNNSDLATARTNFILLVIVDIVGAIIITAFLLVDLITGMIFLFLAYVIDAIFWILIGKALYSFASNSLQDLNITGEADKIKNGGYFMLIPFIGFFGIFIILVGMYKFGDQIEKRVMQERWQGQPSHSQSSYSPPSHSQSSYSPPSHSQSSYSQPSHSQPSYSQPNSQHQNSFSQSQQSNPKFCYNCGSKINGSPRFCTDCGVQLG